MTPPPTATGAAATPRGAHDAEITTRDTGRAGSGEDTVERGRPGREAVNRGTDRMAGVERRQQILDAYLQVIAEHGIDRATFARVAAHVGVSDTLLVRHFTTKERMTAALVDHIIAVYHDTYDAAIPALTQPRRRLEALLAAAFTPQFQDLVDDRAWYALHAAALRDPQLGAQFARLNTHVRQLLEHTLTAAINAGELTVTSHTAAPPKRAADSADTTITSLAPADSTPADTAPVDVAAVATALQALTEGYDYLAATEPDQAARHHLGQQLLSQARRLAGLPPPPPPPHAAPSAASSTAVLTPRPDRPRPISTEEDTP